MDSCAEVSLVESPPIFSPRSPHYKNLGTKIPSVITIGNFIPRLAFHVANCRFN